MQPCNNNGKNAFAKTIATMDDYDILPKPIRDLLKDTAICLHVAPDKRGLVLSYIKINGMEHTVRTLAADIKNTSIESCRMTYGPDHPQATKD